jgi:hypothetical protein
MGAASLATQENCEVSVTSISIFVGERFHLAFSGRVVVAADPR